MRIVRLAALFEHKYGLGPTIKVAASPAEVFKQAKDAILTNYANFVMGKYRALKILAEFGEPHARELYDMYNDLVANIDSLNHIQVFHKVNAILDLIRRMKENPSKYRDSIHNSFEVNKESDRNYREQLKSGFETNLKRISFGLEKIARVLQKYVASSMLHGKAVEPQRKALSKEKLLTFMKTPAAHQHGLDNIEVITQVLAYPESRDRLTTLINAIDRGHVPLDSPTVMAETAAIKQWLDAKKTNLSALEQETQANPAPASLFEEEGEETE